MMTQETYGACRMTTQETYEAIRAYFTEPGAVLARTNNGLGSCRYKTAEGAKCAVGCLIPDELYDEKIENSIANPRWLANNPAIAALFVGTDLRFVRAAQILHDSVARDAGGFVQGLDVLAAAFGLQPHFEALNDELLSGSYAVQVAVVKNEQLEYAF